MICFWDETTCGQVLDRLVLLGYGCYHPSTWSLSTGSSSRGLTWLPSGISHLGVGFALRCFQRLSLPNTATQQCPWQDNWNTGGSSIPVLSY